jgi:antitoxin CcdA
MHPLENSSVKVSELRAAIQQGIDSGEVSTWNTASFNERARSEKEKKWKADHAEFIQAYNLSVDEESLPLDALRTF